MRRLLFFVLSIGWLVSCEVVSTRTVSLPTVSERLVVNGIVSNLGMGVFVSKTAPVLEPSQASSLLEVTASLYKNGEKIEELSKEGGLYTSKTKWSYSSNHALQISHNSLGVASALLEALPVVVPITSTSLSYNKDKSEATVLMYFKDIIGENYYAYKIVAEANGVPFISDHIYRVPFRNILTDADFESKEKEIEFRQFLLKEGANNQRIKADKVRIYLYHLTKSTYNYYYSLNEYDSFNEDAFADISPIKNNISNGYGFVGACTIDTLTITLK